MTSLQELYTRFLGESVWEDFFGPGGQQDGMQHLDCLFYPQKHGPAWRTTACGGGRPDSAAACLFDAIVRDAQGNLTLDPLRCADCESCRRACEEGGLLESRDILPALDAVKRAEGLVYVLIAPAFLGQFDALVSNPPYITKAEMPELEPSVRDFEPHLALDGGEDGMDFYRAIVRNYGGLVKPGGALCFEFGMGQEDAVCAILREGGFAEPELRKDYRGVVRAVAANK